FGSVACGRTAGSAGYCTVLQIDVIHRFSDGLNVQFAYTLAKMLEELRCVAPSDPALSQMTGQFDNPQRVSTGIIYELPFGAGKPLRSDVTMVNKFIGGWQWSGMYIYQTGPAVALPAVVATGVSPAIANPSIDH